jgi:amidase
MADGIWRWTAARMAEAIARREISSREAVASCVGRMHAVNGAINAVTVDLSAQALKLADQADRAVARGDALPPLHGVPVTIKENVDQAGAATTNGVVAYRDAIASEDHAVVANFGKAGAITIGRTNTPAFSMRLDTVNDLRGRTHNPWKRGITPGGSSGGAAASVAAGIVPIAHGNDIAGSVRYPAYCCGLAGLRPSFGRVPAFQPSQKAERPISAQLMSVQGPIARTVHDAKLGFHAMAARDPRDPWWVPVPLDGPPLAKRFTVVSDAADLDGVAPSAPVARALEDAARWLVDAGYERVDARTPGFSAAARLWFDMHVPEFRHFQQADFERDGDDGIRIAMSHLAALAPTLRTPITCARSRSARGCSASGGSRSSGCRWCSRRSARCRLPGRLRRRERRAHRARVARVLDLDGVAGAGAAGARGRDRARRRRAGRRPGRGAAVPRGPVLRRGRGDRGARRHGRAAAGRSSLTPSGLLR